MGGFASLLAALLAWHALADVRPLQWRGLSAAKREHAGALALHGLIHGAGAGLAILLLSGRPGLACALGAAEAAAHAAIDFGKGRGRYGLVADQGLHFVCQIAWALIAVAVASGGAG